MNDVPIEHTGAGEMKKDSLNNINLIPENEKTAYPF